jgi:hypothetical protein
MEKARDSDILAVDPTHRRDAVNLVHYLALRQGDVRNLQRWLGARGLSSLRRCEAHVLATVESVRAAIDGTAPRFGPTIQSYEAGRSTLDDNTDALFGPRPTGRVPRIAPTVSTVPTASWPRMRPSVTSGTSPLRMCRSYPQMVVASTFTMASVSSMMTGLGTCSQAFWPGLARAVIHECVHGQRPGVGWRVRRRGCGGRRSWGRRRNRRW